MKSGYLNYDTHIFFPIATNSLLINVYLDSWSPLRSDIAPGLQVSSAQLVVFAKCVMRSPALLRPSEKGKCSSGDPWRNDVEKHKS